MGPALAGILVSRVGMAAAFWVDTASFGVAFVTLLLMLPQPAPAGGARPSWSAIKEGLRFIKDKRELQGVFFIDINAMVFGMPRALFPELGLTVFGGGATTVGLLFAAPGAGALIAALGSGWVSRIRRAGRATIVAVLIWGLGITAFGFTTSLALALVFLAVAGAGDAISAVFRQTILQITTPDRIRGRISAVQIAVVAGGPRLGDVEAGLVSSRFGPQVAAWTGGLAAAVGALVIGRFLPAFRNWESPDLGADVVT